MGPDRQIRIIPGRNVANFAQYQPKRACAYVRVSTGHTGQMHSLRNQTEYYERKIKSNQRYLFSGIYSDAGISGSREDRPGFLAMMEAARKGLVDVIMTKAVSCFGRQVMDCVESTRELHALGVGVLFEKKDVLLEPPNAACADADGIRGEEKEVPDNNACR